MDLHALNSCHVPITTLKDTLRYAQIPIRYGDGCPKRWYISLHVAAKFQQTRKEHVPISLFFFLLSFMFLNRNVSMQLISEAATQERAGTFSFWWQVPRDRSWALLGGGRSIAKARSRTCGGSRSKGIERWCNSVLSEYQRPIRSVCMYIIYNIYIYVVFYLCILHVYGDVSLSLSIYIYIHIQIDTYLCRHSRTCVHV